MLIRFVNFNLLRLRRVGKAADRGALIARTDDFCGEGVERAT
jgi:hypothetical protein